MRACVERQGSEFRSTCVTGGGAAGGGQNSIFELTGNGDVLEPEQGVLGVARGRFAHSAALV